VRWPMNHCGSYCKKNYIDAVLFEL
jgi:hypothetical protein